MGKCLIIIILIITLFIFKHVRRTQVSSLTRIRTYDKENIIIQCQ